MLSANEKIRYDKLKRKGKIRIGSKRLMYPHKTNEFRLLSFHRKTFKKQFIFILKNPFFLFKVFRFKRY